jgi:L-alanine-DL-glutamate epimerase-like enolase superfamily enzyme
MSAHFCGVIPNFRILEFDEDEVPWRRQLLTNPFAVERGEFVLPIGPGWGADINEEVARAHPAKLD